MTAIHELTGQERAGRYNETPPSGAFAKLADRVAPRERV
jgi:1-acyl-sn-glycerol-3-phosphate acyltransferase